MVHLKYIYIKYFLNIKSLHLLECVWKKKKVEIKELKQLYGP